MYSFPRGEGGLAYLEEQGVSQQFETFWRNKIDFKGVLDKAFGQSCGGSLYIGGPSSRQSR